MSNRFKRGLYNKLNIKKEKLKKESEKKDDQITYEKLEEAEELRTELEEGTLTEEKFEKLESRIEEL